MTVTVADIEWFNAQIDASPYDIETPEDMRKRIMGGARSKARYGEQIAYPSANAFGDYGHYDADGNALMVDGSVIVTEMDDLVFDVIETKDREYRKDIDVRYEGSKGNRVERQWDWSGQPDKSFGYVDGYHLLGDGAIQCWYCATTFKWEWFAKQDGDCSRKLMEHFVFESRVHNDECRKLYSGLPLLRMVGYDGKPRHQRASLAW